MNDPRREKLEEILTAFAMRSGDWARTLSEKYDPNADADDVADAILTLFSGLRGVRSGQERRSSDTLDKFRARTIMQKRVAWPNDRRKATPEVDWKAMAKEAKCVADALYARLCDVPNPPPGAAYTSRSYTDLRAKFNALSKES